MERRINKVAVIGAGLMGHGIAQVASQFAKYSVSLLDIKEEFLTRGMSMIKESLEKFIQKGKITREDAEATIARIKPTLDLREAIEESELIIEAATEDPKVKLDIFRRVSELAPDEAILATNTSSISITLIASVTKKPERVCGMHFFNPPQLMPLVEVIKGAKTSEDTVRFVIDVARTMGKETVVCKKDSPGFIVNRILVPALNEAVFLVHEGVADPEDIDKAVRLGLNWPMGPLQLLDYVGLDTTLNIIQVFMEEFQDSKYRPAPLLREMVRAGYLGRKSGRGFYEWGAQYSTKMK